MKNAIHETNWFTPKDISDEEYKDLGLDTLQQERLQEALTKEDLEEIGLDESELAKLQEQAEHPELADPNIHFISKWRRKTELKTPQGSNPKQPQFIQLLERLQRGDRT